ncbi:MAG: hypothetical protein RLZ98_1109 [Pseudomonadota bacterium]|jgi:YjbE family integral membrane protein
MFELAAIDVLSSFTAIVSEFEKLASPGWWHSHWDELLKVFAIDVTLAGDNAIVVGMAASQVRPEIRSKVIFWGIAAAVVLRILFAGVTQQLLAIVGLTLAGGILLLWVSWKLYRQLVSSNGHAATVNVSAVDSGTATVGFWTAVWQIVLADVSMSLDNVLAVAGAAGESVAVLVIGLALAIVLMAVASHFIAGLLGRFPWITWVGLAIIAWVAADMIYRGSHEVSCQAINFACSEDLFRAVVHRLGISFF